MSSTQKLNLSTLKGKAIFLNTVNSEIYFGLANLNGDGTLTEIINEKWPSKKDEVQTLPLKLQQILKLLGDKDQIKAIFTVIGPGQFSSTRIGITFANMICFSTKCQGIEIINTPELQALKKDSWITNLFEIAKSNGKLVDTFTPFYAKEANLTPSKKQIFH